MRSLAVSRLMSALRSVLVCLSGRPQIRMLSLCRCLRGQAHPHIADALPPQLIPGVLPGSVVRPGM